MTSLESLHRLLRRQIQRHLGPDPAIPSNYAALLKAISDYYADMDQDRDLLQNSLALTSAEFSELNERVRLSSQEQIHQLAYFDALTNLPNRRSLVDRLGQAIAAGRRGHSYGAVLHIDIDNFSLINDTLGSTHGDTLLMAVAQRLRSLIREEDTAARLGADEFAVVVEKLGGDQGRAGARANRIGGNILDMLGKPYRIKGQDCSCSASIGIVLYRGGEDANDILKHAGVALHEAKKSGTGALRFFDPTMQRELERRATLDAELRRALADGHFKLYYQSRVDERGNVRGAEALLRWLRPGGEVPPLEFIPLCEETGLILPIGRWVLAEACRQLKAWEGRIGASEFLLSINVSAAEFRREDFVDHVRKTIGGANVDPTRLEFEITESMLLEDIHESIHKMRDLRGDGISFALDDFGTGYSSLMYLKHLPIHKLKIDRSFVQNLGTDRSDEAIVQTIIQIGKIMGLGVIAEGVENHAQRELLEQLGCTDYQGYLFGKPVSAARFEEDWFGGPPRLRAAGA